MSSNLSISQKFLQLIYQEHPSAEAIRREAPLPDALYRPVLCCFGAGVAIGLFLYALLSRQLPNTTPLQQLLLGLLPFQFGAFGFTLAGLWPLIRRYGWRRVMDWPPSPQRPLFGRLLKQFCLLFSLAFVTNGVFTAAWRLLGLPVQKQPLIEKLLSHPSPWLLVMSLVLAVVLAPVTEEIMLRLVAFHSLRYSVPRHAALLASLLFSLLHGMPQLIPGLLVIGLVLQRTKQTWGLPGCIWLHALYNLFSLLLVLLFQHQ